MKPTIYLADPYNGGHHYRYLRMIEEAFEALGCNVHVLCKSKDAFLKQAKGEGRPVEKTNPISGSHVHSLSVADRKIRLPIGRFNILANRFLIWQQTFRRIKNIEKQTGEPADLVFLPWLDGYIKNYYNNYQMNRYLPALLRGIVHRPWSGIYFHPRYLRLPAKYPMLKEGKSSISLSALYKKTGCRALFTLDEGIKDKLAADIAPTNLYWLPDVLPDTQTDMSWKPLQKLKRKAEEQNRPIILLTGVLNRYKGVLEFYELAERCRHKSWLFVVAGQLKKHSFEPSALEKIQQTNLPNVHTIFERIPTEQHINALLSLSSVIYCCYPRFTHSSSMQLRGAQLGKKVIVVNDHLMKERCQKLPGCHHFDNVESISEAQLEAVLKSSLETEKSIRADFLQNFSFDHFTHQLGACRT